MGSFSQGGIVSQLSITTNSGATTSLSATSKPIQRFVGTSGQTVVLPDATTVKAGKLFYISNRSSGTITINTFGGSFLRYANPQDLYQITLIDNSTSTGVWDVEYSGSATPLRMFGHPTTPDSKLYISPNTVFVDNTPVTSTTPIKGTIPTVVASTIDFQTGTTTGNTFSITFPSSTVGYFRYLALTLLSSGTIQGNFSTESAAVGTLPDPAPLFVTGLPLGYLTLQCTNTSGRFKTANSTTNVIENSVAGVATIRSFTTGGGSGGTSGSGLGDDLNAMLFRASFKDAFESFPDATSPVDISAGRTDSSLYSAVNSYYRLNFEGRRTANSSGSTVTIVGGDPAFTVKVGDYVIADTRAARITAVSTQSSYTVSPAFSPALSGTAVCVSQALYTKDLNNFAGDGQAISAIYSTNIASTQIYYTDSGAAGDTSFDLGTPNVAFIASSDNSSFTSVNTRPASILDNNSILSLPTSSTGLFLVFFANRVGSLTYGAVNLLSYRAFFHIQNSLDLTGFALNQAYCFTDGTGTEINCSAPYLLSGKTAVDLNFNWTVGLNTGQPNGQLQVYLNGQKIPRYVDAVITPDSHYREIGLNTIQLDQDYSGVNLNLEIVKAVGVVSSDSQNTIDIAQIKADGWVTAQRLATDAVETLKIKDLNVTTDKLANLAVTGAKIDNNAVSVSKLATDVTSLLSPGYIANGSAEADTSGWTTYAESSSVTFQDAGDTVTLNSHGLANGTAVVFSSITSTTGISINTTYYVVNAATNTFQVASSPGSSALPLTTNGSGTMVRPVPVLGTGGSPQAGLWIRSTSSPLRGSASFNLVKTGSASRQGQGVSYNFTIAKADTAKVLTISFDYEVVSGTYADGDVTVYIVQDPTGTPVLIQPAGFVIQNVASGVKNRQIATFQTASNSTSYRLVFHVASASTQNYTLAIDSIRVDTQAIQYGAPATDWQDYTSQWTTSTVVPSVGNGTLVAKYRRVGDSLEGFIALSFGSTTTSGGVPNQFYFSLPPGLSIDTTKAYPGNFGLETGRPVGQASALNSGINYVREGQSYVASATTIGAGFGQSDNTNYGALGATYPFTFATADFLTLSFSVPIAGWSSTVQMSSDTDTRVVSAKVSTNSALSFGNGAGNVMLIYDVRELDTHGAYSTSTGVYTVPVSGYYRVSGSFFTAAVASGGADRQYQLRLYKGGSTLLSVIANSMSTVLTNCRKTAQGSVVVYCNAGDALQIGSFADDSGVTLNAGAATQNWVCIDRLSGPSSIAASEAVNAKYTSTVGTSFTSVGGAITVPFANKVIDSHNAFDGSTYRVPVAGKYRVTASMSMNAFSVSINTYAVYSVYKNGVQDSQLFQWQAQASISTNPIGNGSTVISCNAGELLTIVGLLGNTGGTGVLSGSAFQNYVCFERIGN